MPKFLDETGVSNLTLALVKNTKTINNSSIWGSGNISIDPESVDDWAVVDVKTSSTTLTLTSTTLSKKNTRIDFNLNFASCPISARTFQIKIPKSNNRDHYRVFITFKASSTTVWDCATMGKFIDIVGDNSSSGSDTWGVLFGNDTRTSTSTATTHSCQTYYRFSVGEMSNNYAGIVIDFYKTSTNYVAPDALAPNTNMFYMGVVNPFNCSIQYKSTYQYPLSSIG